jgi:hypothetical protein
MLSVPSLLVTEGRWILWPPRVVCDGLSYSVKAYDFDHRDTYFSFINNINRMQLVEKTRQTLNIEILAVFLIAELFEEKREDSRIFNVLRFQTEAMALLFKLSFIE